MGFDGDECMRRVMHLFKEHFVIRVRLFNTCILFYNIMYNFSY